VPKVSAEYLAVRRRQIVDAAAALFAEQGFSRTSMADVVTASGLSTGAVYHYFPSKSDLVLAVVAGRDGTTDGGFTDETPAELVMRLAGYVSPPNGAAHARLVTQIWGDAAVIPELAASVRATHEQLQTHLASLLSAAEAAPDPPAPAAQVTLAALVGLAALVASGIPVDLAAFIPTVIRLFDNTDPRPV
jgi:TetR/AcrR family transcriptional regulator, transcriptional repressor of aconitase